MPRDTPWLTAVARLAYPFFRLSGRRPLTPPRRALILKPCCLSQVMLTTPLLAALSDAYPLARFDWAVSSWARPAVAANPRLTELIDSGRVGLPEGDWSDVMGLIEQIRLSGYDTCFIPSRSSLLAFIAWRAGIPQRVGLRAGGRGFAHTVAVDPDASQEAAVYLSLAEVFGVPTEAAREEFYPTDDDRAAVTRLLVDEVGWGRDAPLVMLHPGGGQNPVRLDPQKRWPAERFALLASHLVRRHGARLVLAGDAADEPAATAVAGMVPAAVHNLAGRLRLGELGALCEVADLYVGNDTGPTHVAAAVGCPTLAIYGPSDPAVTRPLAPGRPVRVLGTAAEGAFSWDGRVTAGEAIAAAEALLAQRGANDGSEPTSEPAKNGS